MLIYKCCACDRLGAQNSRDPQCGIFAPPEQAGRNKAGPNCHEVEPEKQNTYGNNDEPTENKYDAGDDCGRDLNSTQNSQLPVEVVYTTPDGS